LVLELLKHKYVALCFYTQVSYEQATMMYISPTPNIVTHVFLLFLSVALGNLGLQEQAVARVTTEDGDILDAFRWHIQRMWLIAVCSRFWNGGVWKSSDGIVGNGWI
jgi:hypothetical protein